MQDLAKKQEQGLEETIKSLPFLAVKATQHAFKKAWQNLLLKEAKYIVYK